MNDIKKIAVLGCFRSGTNYSKTLLESNFHCEVKNNIFGWKHGFLPIISNDSTVNYNVDFDAAYFVTKNPFSFLVSLHKYFVQAKLNIKAKTEFNDFVTSKIVVFDGGNPDSVELRFSSPLELWNALNWNYASHKNLIHVRYEMLLKTPKITCNKLASRLGVETKGNTFVTPKNIVKRMNDKQGYADIKAMETGQKFKSNQYLDNTYMSQFNADLRAFVIKNVDEELIERLGYKDMLNELLESPLDECQ
ncbi:hypothetical protein [Shewanella japonica]|uniref:hypothetical protein n=1 Tax=Shewanella japonica TaxID=93973 RepID=UPI0024945424|nr:hypothetical protein [Shewanella japonica]